MNRKQQKNEQTEPEPEEHEPESEAQPDETSRSPETSEPASSPEPRHEPRHEPVSRETKEAVAALSAVQKAAQLQVQNLQLVVSRVDQMADSQASLYKAHQEALEVLKVSADLMQEFMAGLQEQTDKLVTVAAALLRYSQEQAAMQASGGTQG